jgi:hypothetical protein
MSLLFTLPILTVSAQDPVPPDLELKVVEVGAPTHTELDWMAEPPTLTEEQIAQLEWGVNNTHRLGPERVGQAEQIAGPLPGSESVLSEERVRSGQPLAPGDAQRYMFRDLDPFIPNLTPSIKSNVMESSTGIAGVYGFYTGNWFAARTNWGGFNWQYVNPFADFPNFCCDQVTLYDEARDIFIWLRMGIPDANGENIFKLSISQKDALGWWTYTVDTFWANEWWDYPHIQLGAQYMYLSWNVFSKAGYWTRTVMLMISLDDLAAASAISIPYAETTEYFTWVPVQGAYHMMYWASNWGPYPDGIGIWRISEDFISSGGSTGIFDFRLRHVPQWSFAQAHCPLSGPHNWLGRTDDRLLTGARYSIYSDGIAEERMPGRKVVGWWWNVAEGGDFPLPYIDGAAFYEDDLTLLPGYLGRPYIWGGDYYCFGFPSITPNKRQDLGAIFNFAHAGLGWAPRVGYSIADEYIHAPPGWSFYEVWNSRALPSDSVWGDYNTLREYEPTQKGWAGAAHVIRSTTPCTRCSHPIFFTFGRERDYQSWFRWRVAGP